MARFKHVDVIEVRIWNQRVGAVAADPGVGAYVFEYDEKWRSKGIDLAPFTMPVTSTERLFIDEALRIEGLHVTL